MSTVRSTGDLAPDPNKGWEGKEENDAAAIQSRLHPTQPKTRKEKGEGKPIPPTDRRPEPPSNACKMGRASLFSKANGKREREREQAAQRLNI